MSALIKSLRFYKKRLYNIILNEDKKIFSFTLFLFGLIGFIDNFIKWKSFFEFGFMTHYRYLKLIFLDFIPFEIWHLTPEYLFVGAGFARSYLNMRLNEKYYHYFWDTILTARISYLLVVLFWPIFIFKQIFSIFIFYFPNSSVNYNSISRDVDYNSYIVAKYGGYRDSNSVTSIDDDNSYKLIIILLGFIRITIISFCIIFLLIDISYKNWF